ncbi:hypothetical protein [Bacillus sp. AFS040349]|uniref:hypothetical protein n=1 Tax=Bacillus sp. AFS040349 TaxID=2033502 RepID=UPI000BFE4588|nr:hypothetical protein [Bacillus sp. AFS040349]PGT76587.1 hypothetical protein COD11_25750 [Bacillus sp. AFS040349]
MHTTTSIKTADFDIVINNRRSSIDELFLDFTDQDRIGIIVRHPAGSAGASALLMASITRFYDFHRHQLGNEPGKLRIYPEYFIFHIEKQQMDHYWMDVWTPNKEVIVEDDAEQILEAINDRGITRLLVEECPLTSSPTFLPETLSSAKSRLKSALVYSHTGRVDHADVSITSCTMAERYVQSSFKRSKNLLGATYNNLEEQRKALIENNRIVETYRRIDVEQALYMLTPNINAGSTTRHYLSLA